MTFSFILRIKFMIFVFSNDNNDFNLLSLLLLSYFFA
jgi:hypothetical protein